MSRDNFLTLLKELHINKREFALLANIPYSTVNNWGTKRGERLLEIPGWVEPFLFYYKKGVKLDYLMSEICAKLEE